MVFSRKQHCTALTWNRWSYKSQNKTTTALLSQWLGPASIAVTFLSLTLWTWRKWPDMLVDFGRELYVPWQLVAGKVLYTDIAYFNGPFSPYLNAFWFHLFGISFTTLIICNLTILAIITYIIYKMFSTACDRFTATLLCLVFLCVFAFSQYARIGNYNFVSPYAHELTHGIGLTVGMIFCLWRYMLRRRLHMLIGVGLLSGLVFLTKAEVFLAAIAAVLLGMTLLHFSENSSRQGTVVAVLFLAGATLVPIALIFGFLSTQMPAKQALLGVAGSWTALLASKVASNPFYQRSMGFDHPWIHLAIMFRISVGIMLLAGAVVVADLSRKLQKCWKILIIGASFALFATSLVLKRAPGPWLSVSWLPVPWLMIGWPLPVITLSAGVVIAMVCIRRHTHEDMIARLFPLAMWSAFGFVLLGKIILYPRLHHYGFALAMPATLVLVVCFVWLIPEAIRRLRGGGDLCRRFAVVMVIADIIFCLKISNISYSHKDFTVGSNGDAIVTYGPHISPGGIATAQLLQRIESLIPPDATFVALPEGVMLNYLSRRPNPTPYLNFMPPEMTIFGETTILDSLRTRSPDFILLVHMDTSEYGVGFFGVDPSYGQQIMAWVNDQYELLEQILDVPLKDDRFGIQILKRRA